MKHVSLLLVLFLIGLVAETRAQNFIWAKQLVGSGSGNSAVVSAVKADAAGNSYVAGQFTGTVDFDPSPAGTITLTASSTNGTGFIAKYDPLGQYIWAKPLAGTLNADFCSPLGLALDANHLYITGNFEGTVDFDPSGAVAPLTATPRTVFMARYTIDGVYDWANQLNTTFFGRGNRIAVGSGHLYLTGQFYGDIDVDPDPGVVVSLSGNTGNADILVAKYTTAGAYVWAHSLGSLNFDTESRSIGVDASGNCYVTGELAGATSFNPPTNTTVVSTSGFLAKYTSAGTLQWVNGLDVRNPDVATDAAGNSFLTGSFRNTVDFDPSAGVTSLTSAGGSDIFITQYGPTGNLLRAQQIGSSGTDVGVAIALDASGNTYLTGVFSNTVDFDPSVAGTANLSVASGVGFFIAKYNAAGDYVRARKINLLTEALSLAADGNQNAYLAGGFLGTANFDPDASPANPGSSLTSVGQFDGFLAKYGECNAIIHVTESGSGVQDGSSWANAYPGTMLQTAINTAASCGGGQVLVARGLYKPTSTTDRTASFSILSGVTVRGGYAADGAPGTRTAFPSSSTLTGVLTGGNRSYHVVQFNEVSVGTTLDGFVITGGDADGSSFPDGLGGGILSLAENAASSPTLSNLVITQNRASQNGGGIFASGEFHSLTATNTLIQSNTAISNGGGGEFNRGSSHLSSLSLIANTAEVGGGIAMGNSHTLTGANVLFQGNTATGTGFGGGLNSSDGISNLNSVTFTANRAEKGGGISIREASSSLTMTNSLLQNNTATIGGGLYAFGRSSGSSSRLTSLSVIANQANIGGGVFITDSHSLTATNSLFQNNTATATGGGIWIGQARSLLVNSLWQGNVAAVSGGAASVEGNSSSLTLVNATLYNNTAPAGTVLVTSFNGQARLINAVGWGNGTPANTFTGGSVQASYSLFETGTTSFTDGGNNRTATVSPFASTTSAELSACSPAIDAGDPATTSATVGNTDVVGNARFFAAGRVDMGAYEFQGPASFTVALTATPSATLSCAQPSVTLTATGGAALPGTSYTFSGPGLSQSGSLTTAVVSQTGVFSVTAINSSGCISVASTTIVGTAPASGTGLVWTGCTSRDWNTPTNWSLGYVPTATDHVVIPALPPNQPVLSTTALASTVEVQSGASLSISSVGSLTISGSRTMNLNPVAFYNRGRVENNGRVLISGTAGAGAYGLWNWGIFNNQAGARITIDRATVTGLANENGGTFTNSATITIGASGSIGQTGLANQASFSQVAGSLIEIDRCGTVGLLNSSGTFTNTGRISIGRSATVGQYGLYNLPGNFVNNPGGEINIDRSEIAGLAHAGLFTNSGTLTIGGVASVGEYGLVTNVFQSTFTNETTGVITIARSTSVGLYNFLCTFVNRGIIQSGRSAGVGQYSLQNSGFFTNASGGQIQLDGSTNTGLLNERGFFTNSATVTVGSTSGVGPTGVASNTALFDNSGCATLLNVVANAVITTGNSGTFTNTGTIIENAAGNSNITGNAGVVLNRNGGLFSTGSGSNTPVSLTGTSPTVCSPANGSFTLTGLQANTTYSLSYTLNGTPTTVSPDPVSDAGGQIILSGLSGGAYTVGLSGSCVAQTLPLSGTLSPAALPLTLTASPSATLTCAIPSLTLTATGGTSYTFSGPGLSQSGSLATAVVSQSGVFSITAVNASGCTSVTSTTISSSTALPTVSIAPTSGTLTCAVRSITLTATSSGTGLLWSNAATTNSITVNSVGTYSVTATGANGCSAVSNSVVIGSSTAAPTGANLSASNSGTLTCSVQTLTLTATATGGAGLPASLSYVFAGPTGTIAGSTNTRPVSASGLYSVTITGANGCTTSASTTVFSNTVAPSAGLVASGTITCAVPAVTLTASGVGQYSFSGPGIVSTAGNQAIVNVGGTYSVTVLNPTNGCFSSTTVSVSSDLGGAPSAPTLSASSSVVCAGSNVVVVATVGGAPSGLQWYRNGQAVSGQTSATLTLGGAQQTQAGSYVLVIAGICSVTSTPFNLTVNSLPTVTLSFPIGTTVVGPGTGVGTITLPDPLPAGFDLSFGVFGGVTYERVIILDRINGFEIRQVDSSTGRFAITRPGPFTITATDANACRQTVQGVITNLPANR